MSDMSSSYWHLLNEDEWAELIRSEQYLSINCDFIASDDALVHSEPDGWVVRSVFAKRKIACSMATSVADDLTDFIACLGIPPEVVKLARGRRRVALDRLAIIFEERIARERG